MIFWFHDAVYDVSFHPARNEYLSAKFMSGHIEPYLSTDFHNVIYDGIIATSKHLGHVDARFSRILDLDLCSFAWDDSFHTVQDCIQAEYVPKLLKKDDYIANRDVFLNKLIEKGYLYRTDEFSKFEVKAISRIKH